MPTRLSLMLALALLSSARAEATPVDFTREVWPILQSRCVSCHGVEKHKAGLRLDTPSGFTHETDAGPLLAAGHPETSELFRRVTASVEDSDVMPPEGQPLAAVQVDTLRRWITQGGRFGDWAGAAAAAPPSTHALPEVPPSDTRAVTRAQGLGALVLTVTRDSHLLDVSFPDAGARISDRDLAALAPLAPHIFRLDLAGTRVSAAGLAALGAMPHLQVLSLARVPIDDRALATLATFPSLRRLNLFATRVSDQGLAEIGKLARLESVVLTGTATGADARERLGATRPGLVVITD